MKVSTISTRYLFFDPAANNEPIFDEDINIAIEENCKALLSILLRAQIGFVTPDSIVVRLGPEYGNVVPSISQ